MANYKKYLSTYVECYKCKAIGDGKLITLKNPIAGVDVTLCNDCYDKYVHDDKIGPEVIQMAQELYQLRKDYLWYNQRAEDLIIDITIQDVKEVTRVYSHIDKTIILAWKDVEDKMHSDKFLDEQDLKKPLLEIKENYNCINYCYIFKIHFDQTNLFAHQIYGYLKALIKNTFVFSKVSALNLENK